MKKVSSALSSFLEVSEDKRDRAGAMDCLMLPFFPSHS